MIKSTSPSGQPVKLPSSDHAVLVDLLSGDSLEGLEIHADQPMPRGYQIDKSATEHLAKDDCLDCFTQDPIVVHCLASATPNAKD